MIDFVLRLAGLLAILFATFIAGGVSALSSVKSEVPEAYAMWAKAREERRGRQ